MAAHGVLDTPGARLVNLVDPTSRAQFRDLVLSLTHDQPLPKTHTASRPVT